MGTAVKIFDGDTTYLVFEIYRPFSGKQHFLVPRNLDGSVARVEHILVTDVGNHWWSTLHWGLERSTTMMVRKEEARIGEASCQRQYQSSNGSQKNPPQVHQGQRDSWHLVLNVQPMKHLQQKRGRSMREKLKGLPSCTMMREKKSLEERDKWFELWGKLKG